MCIVLRIRTHVWRALSILVFPRSLCMRSVHAPRGCDRRIIEAAASRAQAAGVAGGRLPSLPPSTHPTTHPLSLSSTRFQSREAVRLELLAAVELLPDVGLVLGELFAGDGRGGVHLARHGRVLRQVGVRAVGHRLVRTADAVDARAAPRSADLGVVREGHLAPVLILREAEGDAPAELGVVVDLDLLEPLEVAPLPRDGPRELVLLDVDLDQVGDARKGRGELADERVRVQIDLVEVGEVLELLRPRTLEPAIGEVEVGDPLARALGGLLAAPAAPSVVADVVAAALESLPVPVVAVVAARVVGALRARLAGAAPRLERARPTRRLLLVLLAEEERGANVLLARPANEAWKEGGARQSRTHVVTTRTHHPAM